MYRPPKNHRPPQQRGIALFVVIIFVMLSMLLALWASRTALFGEMVVSNDADYQRAFEAAQALLQDAELDIRDEKPNGDSCNAPPCRSYNQSAVKFPREAKDITPLITTLNNETTRCKDGICTRRTGRQDFWNYTNKTSPAPGNIQPGEVKLESLQQPNIGARYGQYTGAKIGNTSNPANQILAERANGKGGWYWIEVIPYLDSSKKEIIIDSTTPDQLKLNLDVYVVFRITALAYGRKEGTMVVLQETYARQRRKD